MTAIKVTNSYFQGSGRIWDRDVGLGPIIKGLAIDNARLAIAARLCSTSPTTRPAPTAR